jgi:uncharacterized protein (DUF305 family)
MDAEKPPMKRQLFGLLVAAVLSTPALAQTPIPMPGQMRSDGAGQSQNAADDQMRNMREMMGMMRQMMPAMQRMQRRDAPPGRRAEMMKQIAPMMQKMMPMMQQMMGDTERQGIVAPGADADPHHPVGSQEPGGPGSGPVAQQGHGVANEQMQDMREMMGMMRQMTPMMQTMMPMMRQMMGGADKPATAAPGAAAATDPHHPSGSQGVVGSTAAYEAAVTKMHTDMQITYTGDADNDFAKGMIPHHEGAIAMANVLLQYGKNPDLRKFAEEVIKAQMGEIATLREWLNKNSK